MPAEDHVKNFNMHILSVDYGTKRVGLAWTDTTLGVVLPFGIVKTMPALVKLIRQEKIGKVIVGFPLGLSGKENANTERVKKFVFELQKEVNVPVELFDERFSSQAADALGGSVSRDERSAMVILEGYLEKYVKHRSLSS